MCHLPPLAVPPPLALPPPAPNSLPPPGPWGDVPEVMDKNMKKNKVSSFEKLKDQKLMLKMPLEA